jgi:hypothetical protein
MTTKPPSQVEPFSEETLEKIAYHSVEGIGTVEPNDAYRLGYHVWRWLTTRQGSLADAVRESGARLTISPDEAVEKIRASLSARNISET